MVRRSTPNSSEGTKLTLASSGRRAKGPSPKARNACWRRVGLPVLACLAVLFSLVGQPVAVGGLGMATAGADQPPPGGFHYPGDPISNPGCDDPPGGCKIDASSGCPTAGPIQEVQAGEHCVPLSGGIQPVVENAPGGGCAITEFVYVDIPRGLDDYEAVWWSTIGLGTRWWSSPGTTWPDTVTGFTKWEVPKGVAAWSGGGGGGASCGEPPDTYGVDGWGATAKWEVSGQVTDSASGDPVPGVEIHADCPSGYGVTTDDNGYYMFLLDKGPCTIVPVPPPGQELDPLKRVLDVEGNIYHVDFKLNAILYYKVQSDVPAVTAGGRLVMAGGSFTETVTLKDLSKTKTVVVAPIYPAISGNAEGGALEAEGSLPNGEAPLSYIVLLRPGQEQVFTSTITTTASSALGTDDGGQAVSGGTRASVQYPVPRAFIMRNEEDFVPLDADQIDVAKGSTDPQTVSIDDSAPDRTFPSGYEAVEDVSDGAWTGIQHLTLGTLNSIWQTLVALGRFTHEEAPTGVIAYVTLENELWQEAKQKPSEMDALDQFVKSSVVEVYKQVPFLLDKVDNLWDGVNTSVYKHFEKLAEASYSGDWNDALRMWADDTSEAAGNTALLLVTPTEMAPALSDVAIARTPGLVTALEDTEKVEQATNLEKVAGEVSAGGAADSLSRVVRAMADLKPGDILSFADAANIFGMSSDQLIDLINFCKKNRVVVTLRSRATEGIQLVEEGFAVVKPAAIKLKTVSAIDIEWLGFPRQLSINGEFVDSTGVVVSRQPLPLATVEANMAKAGVQDGSPQWQSVIDRWNQRMDETLSVGDGYTQELDDAAKKGEITLRWHWDENKINPNAASPPQTVGFRMSGEGATKIPEICEQWVNKVCTGTWKVVTGDLDLVSMTNADASPLSDQYYVNYLEELGQTSVANQHPTTSTWYSQTNDGDILFDPNKGFSDKAKYMYADKCCLLQVGADGVPRAVMLDLKGSWFTSKNDFYLRYIGTELVPAP